MEYQKITKASINSQQNNSEIVTNVNDKEMTKERPKTLEKRQNITDNLRCIMIL